MAIISISLIFALSINHLNILFMKRIKFSVEVICDDERAISICVVKSPDGYESACRTPQLDSLVSSLIQDYKK